jgi:type III secretory pathway component EscT
MGWNQFELFELSLPQKAKIFIFIFLIEFGYFKGNFVAMPLRIAEKSYFFRNSTIKHVATFEAEVKMVWQDKI